MNGLRLPLRAAPATTPAVQVPIVVDGDFIIQLTPVPLSEKEINAQSGKARTIEFRVSRDVLVANSKFFSELFRIQPSLHIVTFENNNTSYVLEMWLYALHHSPQTIPQRVKLTHNNNIWVAIAVGEQLGFAPEHFDKIKPCFLERYKSCMEQPGLTRPIAQRLALPCYVFGHAEGFMKLTKFLAYNVTGDVFTLYPDDFHSLVVDPCLLERPLIAARKHIHSKLEDELSFPLRLLHRATCPCRKITAFDYEEALMSTGCWPFESATKRSSIHEMLDKLAQFNFKPYVKNCESGFCNHDFKNTVNAAIRKAKDAFEGLCLDCMQRSKPVVGHSKEEYIKANSPYNNCWDIDCRFGHAQASWQYSWMGHTSALKDILDKYRREKPQRRPRDQVATSPSSVTGFSRNPITSQTGWLNAAAAHLASRPMQGRLRTSSGEKENVPHHDVDDGHESEEEFYDAEDIYTESSAWKTEESCNGLGE